MILIYILLLSILGFLNAFYLYYQHVREIKLGKKMFCLLGGDCGAVVGSKYGKTFGVKNEKLGMSYYLLLIIYILIIQFFPQIGGKFEMWVKLSMMIAAAFSLYLLFLQAVVLKKFCSWCLIAIFINLLIFYTHSAALGI